MAYDGNQKGFNEFIVFWFVLMHAISVHKFSYICIYISIRTLHIWLLIYLHFVWGSNRHLQSRGFVNITHLSWYSGGPNSRSNQKVSRICFRPTCCVQMVLQDWQCFGLYISDPHSLRGQRPTSVRLPLAPLGLMRLQWHLWQLLWKIRHVKHTQRHQTSAEDFEYFPVFGAEGRYLLEPCFSASSGMVMRLHSAVCHTWVPRKTWMPSGALIVLEATMTTCCCLAVIKFPRASASCNLVGVGVCASCSV